MDKLNHPLNFYNDVTSQNTGGGCTECHRSCFTFSPPEDLSFCTCILVLQSVADGSATVESIVQVQY